MVFGELWHEHVAFIFIRPQRYTYEFTEKAEGLTLSFFSEEYRDALKLCGRVSGRDCDKIAEAGYTPMAYFNSYQSRQLMYLHELEDYPFWLALYSDRMTFPYRFEMWQYTDSGRVPGIDGNVDINLYFVDEYF